MASGYVFSQPKPESPHESIPKVNIPPLLHKPFITVNSNEHGLPTKMANALKKIVPAIGVAAGGTWAALTSFNDE